MLNFFVNCSLVNRSRKRDPAPVIATPVPAANTATQAPAKSADTKSATALLSVVEEKHESTIFTGDKIVCANGKNLGTLKFGSTCQGEFIQCKSMLKRQENIPTTAIVETTQKKVETPIITPQKKTKWSLKGRNEKLQTKKPENTTTPAKDQIDVAQIAKLIDKELEKKDNITVGDKVADNIASTITSGAIASAVAKKVEEKKVEAAPKEPEIGEFCVHAILYNLNYCCYFKARKDGQEFANTQPDEEEFNKKLNEAKLAEKRDEKRKAKEQLEAVSKALELAHHTENHSASNPIKP